jgi:hypothetical protein
MAEHIHSILQGGKSSRFITAQVHIEAVQLALGLFALFEITVALI